LAQKFTDATNRKVGEQKAQLEQQCVDEKATLQANLLDQC